MWPAFMAVYAKISCTADCRITGNRATVFNDFSSTATCKIIGNRSTDRNGFLYQFTTGKRTKNPLKTVGPVPLFCNRKYETHHPEIHLCITPRCLAFKVQSSKFTQRPRNRRTCKNTLC